MLACALTRRWSAWRVPGYRHGRKHMTQLITGVFTSHAAGMAAEAALKRAGFDDEDVQVVSGGEDDKSLAPLASLVGYGITREDAARFASVVRGGGAVVSVRAIFGTGNQATHILKSHKAATVRSGALDDGTGLSHDAAPFSELFGWATLSRGAAPFSNFFGLDPKIKPKKPQAGLLRNPAPFSSALKLPVLSRFRA